jgi:hypothetical protein
LPLNRKSQIKNPKFHGSFLLFPSTPPTTNAEDHIPNPRFVKSSVIVWAEKALSNRRKAAKGKVKSARTVRDGPLCRQRRQLKTMMIFNRPINTVALPL